MAHLLTEQEIINKMTQHCTYYVHYCTTIRDDIIKLHSAHHKFSVNFSNKYSEYLFRSVANNGYMSQCLADTAKWLQPLLHVIDSAVPSNANIENFALVGSSYPVFLALVNRKVQIPQKCLTTSIQISNMQVAELLLNHITVTSEHLELACQKNNYNLVLSISNQKVMPTTQCAKNAIIAHNNQMLNLLLNIGVHIDTECLMQACNNYNEEAIRTLLDHKVEPNRSCFNALVQRCYGAYNSTRGDSESYNAQKVANLIELLINAGYQIEYEDVLQALQHSCYILNIERFKIKFDQKFLETCSAVNYYPYNLDIKPTMEIFYKECDRQSNFGTIKKFISMGLKPDAECLHRASRHKQNKKVLEILITAGVKVDTVCLENMAADIGNAALTYLLKEFKKNNNIQPKKEEELLEDKKPVKKGKGKIKAVDLVEAKEKEKEIVVEEAKEKKVAIAKKAVKKIEPVFDLNEGKKPKPKEAVKVGVKVAATVAATADVEPIVSNMEFEEIDIESESEFEAEAKPEPIKVKVVDGKDTEVVEEYDTIRLKPDKKTNPSQKTKCTVSKEISKMLGLAADAKLTFLELRKKIMAYVKDKKLSDKNNGLYIKINTELATVPGFKKNKYLHFNDIDILVANSLD